MWISGLPEFARIITAGQGFAQIGEAVRITVAGSTSIDSSSEVPPIRYVDLK